MVGDNYKIIDTRHLEPAEISPENEATVLDYIKRQKEDAIENHNRSCALFMSPDMMGKKVVALLNSKEYQLLGRNGNDFILCW